MLIGEQLPLQVTIAQRSRFRAMITAIQDQLQLAPFTLERHAPQQTALLDNQTAPALGAGRIYLAR